MVLSQLFHLALLDACFGSAAASYRVFRGPGRSLMLTFFTIPNNIHNRRLIIGRGAYEGTVSVAHIMVHGSTDEMGYDLGLVGIGHHDGDDASCGYQGTSP